MMTEINLNELERLAKGITPGPWSVKDDWHFYILDATGKREIAKISNKYRSKDVNAAYIAAACNAVPKLLDERHALYERICELESELEVYREKERLEWERSRDERF